jgi:hypothetical protein
MPRPTLSPLVIIVGLFALAGTQAQSSNAAESDDAIDMPNLPATGLRSAAARAKIQVLPPDDPCVRFCDFAGGWKTADCQECVFRGLVNGYLAHNKPKDGYNYALFAAQSCRVYEAQAFHLGLDRKLYPTCFLDHIHKACNAAVQQ